MRPVSPVSTAEVMSSPRPYTITPADRPTDTTTCVPSVLHGYVTLTCEGKVGMAVEVGRGVAVGPGVCEGWPGASEAVAVGVEVGVEVGPTGAQLGPPMLLLIR